MSLIYYILDYKKKWKQTYNRSGLYRVKSQICLELFFFKHIGSPKNIIKRIFEKINPNKSCSHFCVLVSEGRIFIKTAEQLKISNNIYPFFLSWLLLMGSS